MLNKDNKKDVAKNESNPKLVPKNKSIIKEEFINERPTPGFITSIHKNLPRVRNLLNKTKTPGL